MAVFNLNDPTMTTYSQGGSVTIASNSSPSRNGFCVTSNVQRSKTLEEIPYWVAARMMPGGLPWKDYLNMTQWLSERANLRLSSDDHQYRTQIRAHQNGLLAVSALASDNGVRGINTTYVSHTSCTHERVINQLPGGRLDSPLALALRQLNRGTYKRLICHEE